MHLKEALTKYQEVINNLEFARELQKSFVTLGQEVSPTFWLLSAWYLDCSNNFYQEYDHLHI